MERKPQNIQAVYFYLVFGNTLAASLIWGINTIFLLNAGLTNFQAFLANAFYTAGMVIFDIPTGIIADIFGRKVSYLLGTITLSASTLLYLFMWQIRGPFWGWAISSILIGLGFTFFSGAVEAWLVDALRATKFRGSFDSVFAKGQIIGGISMLAGSVLGGIIAQFTNLGVPYEIRATILMLNFIVAFFLMKDLGFSPSKSKPFKKAKNIFSNSLKYGLGNPPIRWIMFSSLFAGGISIYVFYALQPYLLQLYGNPKAYTIAGLVAALAATAQIAGGFGASQVKKFFRNRTTAIFTAFLISTLSLFAVSLTHSFWAALVLIFIWGLMFSAISPITLAYINGIIPSKQRATVLSFNSVMSSIGGVFVQPSLGKAADVWGYPTSYLVASVIQILGLPFILLAKKEKAKGDLIK